tara:strand:- start:2134 stop:2400 length:267 start_codon:yes stop_codon:yes gene_type:complete
MKTGINIINKKYQHIIDDIMDEPYCIGVYLKRPYIFSVSEASCTFFDLDSSDYEHLSPSKKRNAAIKDLNACIRDEATKIDPDEWDKG